jgi:hypothetical protein
MIFAEQIGKTQIDKFDAIVVSEFFESGIGHGMPRVERSRTLARLVPAKC